MAPTRPTADTRHLAEQAVTADLLADNLLASDAPHDAPDGYELVRQLGRGGGGEVYLARELSLDRPVAIKFLLNASPADIERFRREARFAARLGCECIVQVHALGDHHGQPYIVMQYLDGGSLAKVQLDHHALLQVVRQVGGALQHAHAAGIIHRDIKPENILLDSSGRPYVSDFGIARDLSSSPGHTISREGQIIGTPALMPPEQARGDIHAIDARSDIYALGATMYYKLTGRYPFEAPNLIDLLHQVIHEPPRLPRAHDPSIPPAVEALVMRCLEKDQDDRFPAMRAFLAELDDIIVGAPADAGASAPWFRALVRLRPESPARRLGVDGVNGAAGSPIVGEDALEVFRELAEWDANLYRITGSLTRAFQRLDDLRGRLDEKLESRPDLAWARFCRGSCHYRRGNIDAALDDMERVIDRVPGPAAAQFALGRAYLARFLRDHDAAHQHISIVGAEYSLASSRPGLEQAIIALKQSQRLRGDLRLWHREYADAVERLADRDYDGCVSICDRILEREPELEDVWKLRGDAQQFAGAEPFESYDRAVEIRRSFYEAFFARAHACLRFDRLDEARASLQRAIEIHPEFTEAIALYARTLLRSAGDDVEQLRRARDLAARARSMDPDSYDASVTLAEIDTRIGRLTGDDAPLETALQHLDLAWNLGGCSNRVNLLRVRALIARAELAIERGDDPQPHFDAVRPCVDHEAVNVPDNEPWLETLAQLERVRRAAGR